MVMIPDLSKAWSWLEHLKDVISHITFLAIVGFLLCLTVLALPQEWSFFKELIELREANRGVLLLLFLACTLVLLLKICQQGIPFLTKHWKLSQKMNYIRQLEPQGKNILKQYFTTQQTSLDLISGNLLVAEMSRKGVIHYIHVPIRILGDGNNTSPYRIDDELYDYLKKNRHILDTTLNTKKFSWLEWLKSFKKRAQGLAR